MAGWNPRSPSTPGWETGSAPRGAGAASPGAPRLTRRAVAAWTAAAGGGAALAACGRADATGGPPAAPAAAPRTLKVAANTGGGYQLEQWKPIWAAWERDHPNL